MFLQAAWLPQPFMFPSKHCLSTPGSNFLVGFDETGSDLGNHLLVPAEDFSGQAFHPTVSQPFATNKGLGLGRRWVSD